MKPHWLRVPLFLLGYGVLWGFLWSGLHVITRRHPNAHELAFVSSFVLALAATVRLRWEIDHKMLCR